MNASHWLSSLDVLDIGLAPGKNSFKKKLGIFNKYLKTFAESSADTSDAALTRTGIVRTTWKRNRSCRSATIRCRSHKCGVLCPFTGASPDTSIARHLVWTRVSARITKSLNIDRYKRSISIIWYSFCGTLRQSMNWIFFKKNYRFYTTIIVL